MSLNFKQKLIASKIETIYGTDATPAGANAILTRNLNVTPIEGDKLERNLDGSSLGNKGSALTNKRTKHDFEVELGGAGAAGTVPGYGVLLRACAFQEVVDPGVDVQYSPVSNGFESVSEYMEQDGILHSLLGGRGNVTFNINAGEYPFMKFDFTGFFVPPVAGNIAAPDFSGFQLPEEVNNSNTTAATFFGYAVKMKSLSVDMANVINYRNLVGQEAVLMGDRAPSGQIVIEAPTLAEKNFFAEAAGNNTGALVVNHGTAAGKIIQLDIPKAEIDAPTYSDDNGILMMTIGFRPLPVAGDDEVKLTIK
ncbi:hypothetical protein [Paremcibacter congregatus]|uniref:hypothetical protein n=1 Tax=Paremcibacter congregatus TaxID=2043170 RepID=UPI0030EEA756